jgi:uncharacterized SAM-binding protein YcdF (DUF218 family)
LRRRRVVHVAAVCLAIVILLGLTHSIWLGWLGDMLVSAMPPVKADAALVLAGDLRGNRIRTAAELVRSGYVPKVLVSGPMEWYGINEADLAIRFAVANGYPSDWFEPLNIRALSTYEEARAIGQELAHRGIRRLLIVTSDFHTARAGKIFRRALPSQIEIRMVAAPDKYFTPHGWWHTREGRKTFFYESTKTVTEIVGM